MTIQSMTCSIHTKNCSPSQRRGSSCPKFCSYNHFLVRGATFAQPGKEKVSRIEHKVAIRLKAGGWKKESNMRASLRDNDGRLALTCSPLSNRRPAKTRVLTTQRARKTQYDLAGKWHPDLQQLGHIEGLASWLYRSVTN